jgi:hypothetical protein
LATPEDVKHSIKNVQNLFHILTELINTIINISSPRNILHLFFYSLRILNLNLSTDYKGQEKNTVLMQALMLFYHDLEFLG